MLFVFKIHPLCLNGRIGFHVYMTLAPLETVLLIDGYQIVEKQGVGSLGTILGQHSDEQEIDNISLMELQSSDNMPPAKRKQTTLATFLQSLGERRDGDAHTDNVVIGRIPVFYHTEHIHREKLKILVDIGINLTLSHLRITIEVGKGLVHHIEHLLAITIGTKQMTYSDIYEITVHELAHASHFSQVGVDYWTPYVDYVIQSFVTAGGNPYGSGSDDKAGYCEIGEMWGYFMQETLKKDRYGGTVKQFGNAFWFKPDIFTYLYEHGISRGELYRALTSEVTTMDDLKEQLITLLPDRETVIKQTFQHYGK